MTGKVTFRFKGDTYTRTLSGEEASFTMPRMQRDTTVKVTYLGNATFDEVMDSVTIEVRR